MKIREGVSVFVRSDYFSNLIYSTAPQAVAQAPRGGGNLQREGRTVLLREEITLQWGLIALLLFSIHAK